METNAPEIADPRWHTFTTQGFACSCGERHVGLFPINLHHPVGWQGKDDYEPDDAMRLDGDFLSSNFCVVQGKFFAMRARLPIRIIGAAPFAFMYTVWANLDRAEFEQFFSDYRNNKLNPATRVRARLVNRIGGYPDTYNLVGTAFQDMDGGPPVLIVHGMQAGMNNQHPLLVEQREGIGIDKMLELFAAYDHDMRGGIPPTN